MCIDLDIIIGWRLISNITLELFIGIGQLTLLSLNPFIGKILPYSPRYESEIRHIEIRHSETKHCILPQTIHKCSSPPFEDHTIEKEGNTRNKYQLSTLYKLIRPKKYWLPCRSAGKESTWIQGTPVQILSREDPLEKGQAVHSSIQAWRTPWTI